MRWKIHFALLASVVGVSGCSTNAEQELARINGVVDRAEVEWKSCDDKVTETSAYRSLEPFLANEETPSLRALSDPAKASDIQIQELYAVHAAMAPCRKLRIEAVGNIHPSLVAPIAEWFAASDAAYLGVAERRLTWGQFAQAQYAAKIEAKRQFTAAGMAVNQGLARSHSAELARRQRAVQALAQWSQQQQMIYQQQQMINAMNAPRTTNCRYIGAHLNCTTF